MAYIIVLSCVIVPYVDISILHGPRAASSIGR